MTHFDIFNGDADGICALIQMRLAEPQSGPDASARVPITGVKRDIALVAKAKLGPGDSATILDISFDKNREAIVEALDAGCGDLLYADHHFAGDVPEHPRLTTLIDTTPTVCTSLIVYGHLCERPEHGQRGGGWAATGAFGDNLTTVGNQLVSSLGLDASARDLLEELGTLINYNGYGASVDDLHFPPAELLKKAQPFADPLQFISDDRATFETLRSGFAGDMANARAIEASTPSPQVSLTIFPDTQWARRVSGVYGNALATENPGRAHAIATERADGTYLISVRAPLENRTGADDVCRQFPTGGGRKAAAGINALPSDMLDAFLAAMASQYQGA